MMGKDRVHVTTPRRVSLDDVDAIEAERTVGRHVHGEGHLGYETWVMERN